MAVEKFCSVAADTQTVTIESDSARLIARDEKERFRFCDSAKRLRGCFSAFRTFAEVGAGECERARGAAKFLKGIRKEVFILFRVMTSS